MWMSSWRMIPWDAQNIELNIVHEDEHILVIDKPAGLVFTWAPRRHRAQRPAAPTAIAEVPRARYRRLDKDTTGRWWSKTIPA
jgi:23S rRNA pseudouridine1911/1915/1917 synthase